MATAAPPTATPVSAVVPRDRLVQNAVNKYRDALNARDFSSFRAVYPSANVGALSAALQKDPQTMSFDVRTHAYKLLGVDLFRIKGLNAETILRIVSEVGVDLSAFPTEKHFASWLCLSPNRRVTGGKVISSKTKTSSNRAAAAFRQAAVSVQRSQTELGAYYRRMKAKKGPAVAVTARSCSW